MNWIFRLLLLSCVAVPFSTYSQTVSCKPIFKRLYGGTGNDEAIYVSYCTNGGMIIAGRTTSYSAGLYDGFLLKLSDAGTPEWTRIIGGAQNDKLLKVRQTADGGFIAIGLTFSFNNPKGESWVVRTDANGTVLWSKRYGNLSVNGEKPKDIVPLSDGTFILAINFNDSTAQSNGILLKLNPSGTVIWSRSFDHGNDDGINTVAEYGDTLLVAGYATMDKRDAIVMKLMYPGQWNYNNQGLWLTFVKQKKDGSVFYQRRSGISTGTGQRIEFVNCMGTDDGGYMTIQNDTTPGGYAEAIKNGPYGSLEWGRPFYDYGTGRMTGMDKTGGAGYVFAGYRNDFFSTGGKNRIQVFKTDRLGKYGPCTNSYALDFLDIVIYTTVPFTWNSISTPALTEEVINLSVNPTLFTSTVVCQQTACDTIQTLQDSCSVSLVAEYKTELVNEVNDVERLTDGDYALAGHYSYYWNYEPTLIKLKPNGAVRWSKTYNNYIRNGYLLNVIATGDGGMLANGVENYTINNGTGDSTILLKLDNAGNVLWAKKYGWSGKLHPQRVQQTADGGYILLVNAGYGNGSPRNFVLKLDANGNFIWKKEIHRRNSTFNQLLYDGTNVYVSSRFYISYSYEVVAIAKLNGQTGDLLWSTTVKSNGQEYYLGVGMHVMNDTLMVMADVHVESAPYQYKDATGFFKLKTSDGSLLSSFKLTNPNILFPNNYLPYNDYFYSYVGKRQSDFVVAQNTANNGDTTITVTYLNSSGQVKWSRKFSNLKKCHIVSVKLLDGTILIAGKRYEQLYDNRNIFYPFLIKMDTSGVLLNTPVSSSCQNVSFSTLVEPIAASSISGAVDSVTTLREGPYFGELLNQSYFPYVRNTPIISKVFCSTPGNCNAIAITGNDTVCNTRDTLLYRLIRNAGCTAGAYWQVDTAAIEVISQTDTTLRVRFKRFGYSTLIKANITSGCLGLTAQKQIFVPVGSNTLSLGPDTSLCTGNTYLLNAHTGYRHYYWYPNGSTDSVYLVNSPGVYKVTVEDFCGNQAIDSVLITPLQYTFTLGGDTSKCNRDSLILTATQGFTQYHWTPAYNILPSGTNTAIIYPDSDTSYIVFAYQGAGCIVRDTIQVHVKSSPSIYLGADTSLCTGSYLSLLAPAGFTSYQWNTGATSTSIVAASQGSYSVTATAANGCSSKDTLIIVNVLNLPAVNLGKDTSICRSTSYRLQPGNFTRYQWQDGSTGSSYTVTTPGVYSVTVVDNAGCSNSDTLNVLSFLELPTGFLPDTLSFCDGGNFLLKPLRSYARYYWQDGSFTPDFSGNRPGKYVLQVTDVAGCNGRDTTMVSYKDCYNLVYFPSAFTPNQDNLNDVFRPKVYGVLRDYNLVVFSRWGEKVFETTDPAVGWNGMVKGTIQATGTYLWKSNYTFITGPQKSYQQQGTVILVR